MKILDRYIAVTLLQTTAIALIVLLSLFTFLSLIDQLEETGRGNYDVITAIKYVLLILPRIAYELIPIAAVMGSMTTLGILAHNSELVIIRATGMSLFRLGYAFVKGGVVIIIFAVVIGEFIAPYCEQTAQHMRSVALTQQIALKTKNGFWSRDGSSFINIRKILPGDQVEDIYIYEFDKEDRLRISTYAKRAEYLNNQWLLEDIEQSIIEKEKITKKYLKFAAWESLLNPEVLNLLTMKPQYLTLLELYNYINYLRQNGQNSKLYEQALWSKIINPLTIIAMVMLGVPLVNAHARTVSVSQRVFMGCFIGIAFHIFNQVSGQMGVVYSINPAASAIIPTVLILTGTFWMMRKNIRLE
ncbi:MAG: LPS export ABC transporter permease LptG [Gammaproteobacteria bacterium RIFCSPLOWO2_02_47_7]|nr:MAG: LPS export ABC transporter permease LptG [Gammaproteobacteria bacterium RIFCSPLOWO2_02_47_7]